MTANVLTDVNRPYVPRGGTTVTAEIEVEPGRQERPPTRQIALCLDASGSMAGELIEQAREGAEWIFGLLEPTDYLSIVAFDNEVETVLEATRWGTIDRTAAVDLVTEISAGGGTDMYSGLLEANASLDGLPSDEDTVRRILLLSDGKDNRKDADDFAELAREIDREGIRIEAAGIGTEYREATIRSLGTAARGEWTHLARPGDIETFFGEAVEDAGSVVAPDAELELVVDNGVDISEVYRAIPQAQTVDPEWERNQATIRLPDLLDRETQCVVLKLRVPERATTGTVVLADVTLTARGETASGEITVEYTDDNDLLAEHVETVDIDHRETVVRTELGRGNVAAAQTEIEKMTEIHGDGTEAVEAAKRQTQIVSEGGRAEQSEATRVVTDEGVQE
ncbi:vWA domain-containing protein [Haloarcula halophila]|uniref:vWA domain-containing protein n=1 Tax=Haloarcula TaxID=2237 RepID=UPI0023E4158C|nr:VWA domain-containing protein [Halomicroarcula sp. DFY41]